MEHIAKLVSQLHKELFELEGTVSAEFNSDMQPHVQLTASKLMELSQPCKENPDGYDVTVENTAGGGVEFSLEIGDVEFFAMASKEEYDHYFGEEEEGIPIYVNDMNANMEIAGMSHKDFL